MTIELPSIGYSCLLCGKQLTELENNHAIGELDRIIAERTKEQFKAFKEQYDKISDERLKEKEQEIQEMKIMLRESNREKEGLRNTALNVAREEVREELQEERNQSKEKDIQIKRYQEDVRELNQKLTVKQSELRGEVGEINLEEMLQVFREKGDIITLKKRRGERTAEIIHQIMGPNRQLLNTVIVYDNKNTKRIVPHDVLKSKSYKEVHNTDYSIIVSRNIPKEYSANGKYAEKDGVIIIHPELLEPVVGNIRRGLVEIYRTSNNKQEMITKQSKLYSYITGQEFRRQLEALKSVHTRLTTLQGDEEKSHKTLWNKRTEAYKELEERYTNISSGLDAVLNDIDIVNGDYISP